MDNLNNLVPALSRDRQKQKSEKYLKGTLSLRGEGDKSCSNLAPGKQKLPFAKQTAPGALIHSKVRLGAVLSHPVGSYHPAPCLYLSGCSHLVSSGI